MTFGDGPLLVADHYLLVTFCKIAYYSLQNHFPPAAKSLITRCKVPRYSFQNSVGASCENHFSHIAKFTRHSLQSKSPVTHYSLQNSFVICCKVTIYSFPLAEVIGDLFQNHSLLVTHIKLNFIRVFTPVSIDHGKSKQCKADHLSEKY